MVTQEDRKKIIYKSPKALEDVRANYSMPRACVMTKVDSSYLSKDKTRPILLESQNFSSKATSCVLPRQRPTSA